MKNIIITTGDSDGIGLEIVYKSIQKIKPLKDRRFFIFYSDKSEKKYKIKIEKSYPIFSSFQEASRTKKYFNFIKNNSSPAIQFENSVLLAKEKLVSAIVTAPLSKEEIQISGLKDRGHTDIMRRILKLDTILMAFWGKHFSLLLATDHIPLKDVSSSITATQLKNTIETTALYLKFLTSQKKCTIGVLGLNPHAGEILQLGMEEREIILPAILQAQHRGILVEGPLVPDVCFHDPDYKKYSVYIAMYHDQGLIPFKIYHKKNRGVQISLNLPFVRTSVDHGTAKNIFGKNKADPTSMVLSIQKALELLK